MMFQTVGHRPRTQQRVRLGASKDGKLVSLQHDYVYTTSMLDNHHEDCGEATPFQYSVPNLRVRFGRAKRNIGATADMRGPGAVPGHVCHGIGDERTCRFAQDRSVKLRMLNEPKNDESLEPAILVAAFAGVLRARRRRSLAGRSARPKWDR